MTPSRSTLLPIADIISNGHTISFLPPSSSSSADAADARPKILESATKGGLKRCGGQGDVLSGTTGLLIAWAGLWAAGTYELRSLPSHLVLSLHEADVFPSRRLPSASDVTPTPPSPSSDPSHLPLLAAYAASTGTRLASLRTFDRLGRAMQTSDVLAEVGGAFGEVLGEGAEVDQEE